MVNWHFQSRHAHNALTARKRFGEYLRNSCIPGSDIWASETIYGELVSNVVRHAPGAVEVSVKDNEDRAVTLCVRDNGKGFAFRADLPADISSDGGRGLFIVSVLSEGVSVRRTRDGSTEVHVVLPVIAKT